MPWTGFQMAFPRQPRGSKEQALEYIREQSGKHFDPQVVEVFMKWVGEE